MLELIAITSVIGSVVVGIILGVIFGKKSIEYDEKKARGLL